ncbi:UNVERIFIED_CONTAM: hypothetical protein K2H54_056039 [Gekko kuhli]
MSLSATEQLWFRSSLGAEHVEATERVQKAQLEHGFGFENVICYTRADDFAASFDVERAFSYKVAFSLEAWLALAFEWLACVPVQYPCGTAQDDDK